MRLRQILALSCTLPLCAAPLPDADEHEAAPVPGIRRGWTIDTQQREAVRLFYRVRFRATPPSGYWQGNVDLCDAGETIAQHRAAMLARINWFRAMAGIPADIEEDPAATRKTQAAALVVAANGKIAHEIDASWRCFSEDAKEGAHTSLLGTGETGPDAVTDYMRDAGEQNAAVHHRRWLLYPQTKLIGLGDVPQRERAKSASGFTAFDGLYGTSRPLVKHEFVAWPPPGWVPYQLVFPRWSFSLPDADFSAATLTVSRDGEPQSVTIEPKDDDAGEPTLVWRLADISHQASWPKPEHAVRYKVVVDKVKQGGQEKHFDYEVAIFDVDEAVAGRTEASVSGPQRMPLAGADFAVLPQPGATGAHWRAMRLAPWPLNEGAETGYGAFSYSGSNDYPVLDSKVMASGKQAFRLAHVKIGSESLLLAEPLLLNRPAAIAFKSRRGVAGADEIARVEVLVEGRDNWETVFEQKSDGKPASAEASFSEKRVDLSGYADRLIQLRFRYGFDQGDFFAPDDPRVGWYLDDIRLEGAHRIVEQTEPARASSGKFKFAPTKPGNWRLQARPTVYRAPGDWGPLATVKVE